ncbi:MAG: hypothetical protein F4121_06900 [Acidimicrobiia bacterium]|nr:hypothetical protein [Acidimicrobiia bacterium]MYC44167.1 hypothetical protein [Acidimicrobiia bacterium]MYI19801.1 hypothetical protein [Acidimicrobiia bacterium]
MLTLIILAACVPILAGVVYAASRNGTSRLAADVRGIALQTVIVIVVLLAIAGAVAGVLLTRSGDVTTQLEQQDITPGLVTNAATCQTYRMGGVAGTVVGATCVWTDSTTGVADTDVNPSRCNLVRGRFDAGVAGPPATASTCTVTITV